ncbi:FUSC family protein [Streptomyces sp. NPDC004647]|uniref:FUSC family protein n=1 Tax=Streptomyces sp. NPDC004647 TaxID=3154671 RepID=UPI0033BD8C8E
MLQTLRRKDPGFVTVRQAARVTLVACAGFYITRYAFGDTITAVYALFGAVALGALSRLPPPPVRQARICVAALPAACVLVIAGTLLAGNAWAAAAGMAVVGFAVSFAGVAGPALRGTANGMQLFYILPCFPPYALDTLDSRLAGVAIGVLGLAAAQLLFWPAQSPERYEERLARAAAAVAEWLGGLPASRQGLGPDARLDTSPAAGPDTGTGTGADTGTGAGHGAGRAAAPDEAAEQARTALEALRLVHLPFLERPASPSVHDRALAQAAMALRRLGCHVENLASATPVEPAAAGRALLADVRQALHRTADSLAAGVTPADAPALRDGLAALANERAGALRADPDGWARRAQWDVLARQAALHSQVFITAARVAAEGGAAVERVAAPFRYARQSAATLWMRRFHAHLTRRSVYWQGAVRTGLALATARLVVEPLELTHGFWVLLATLTLMRGTAADTRASLRQAMTGTLYGAVAAAVVLTVVADHSVVYRAALPPVMFGAFCATLLGPAAVQALFTLVVSMAFAQLSEVTWTLAEVRFVDVLVGGVVGALIGMVAWPRGSASELRRLSGEFIARAGTAVRSAVDAACCPRGDTDSAAAARMAGEQARHTMGLAQAAYELHLSERPDPVLRHVDWQAILGAGKEMVLGAEGLAVHYPPGALDAGPGVRTYLTGAADLVEEGGERLAAGLGEGATAPAAGHHPGAALSGYRSMDRAHRAVPERQAAGGSPMPVLPVVPPVDATMDSHAVLAATNTAVWLHLVTVDLRRLARELAAGPQPSEKVANP